MRPASRVSDDLADILGVKLSISVVCQIDELSVCRVTRFAAAESPASAADPVASSS
jgi:hypothetical protein